MSQESCTFPSDNQEALPKRPYTESFSSGHYNQKRKKRFKQASELGLHL